jgi:ribonuclease P protein component
MGPGGAFAPPEKGSQAVDRQDPFEARRELTSASGRGSDGRLVRPAEFRQVFESGRRMRLRHLDVVWRQKEAGQPRLGLIVPKFQSTAVARNRLRRRVREIWRRRFAPGLPPLDLIVKARRESYAATFAELANDLGSWASRFGVPPA